MNWLKKIFQKRTKPIDKQPYTVFYEHVVISRGSGTGIHTIKRNRHPLDHIWRIDGNKYTCVECGFIVEKRRLN